MPKTSIPVDLDDPQDRAAVATWLLGYGSVEEGEPARELVGELAVAGKPLSRAGALDEDAARLFAAQINATGKWTVAAIARAMVDGMAATNAWLRSVYPGIASRQLIGGGIKSARTAIENSALGLPGFLLIDEDKATGEVAYTMSKSDSKVLLKVLAPMVDRELPLPPSQGRRLKIVDHPKRRVGANSSV